MAVAPDESNGISMIRGAGNEATSLIEGSVTPELQKSINVDMDAQSVRLDVYVKDDRETVYDIEMQVSDTKELPKRSRYYQGMIDLQLVDAGQHYKKLNKSYIIFICPFDLYGKGRHIYTFENICKEDNSIFMGDEAVKIFLNADGTMDDVSRELKAFLDYVAGQKPEDSYVEKLEEAVQEAKKNREWRHDICAVFSGVYALGHIMENRTISKEEKE